MSAHMRMHPTKGSCEIILKMPGGASVHSYLPMAIIPKLEAFIHKYTEEDPVDWKVVAKESIEKHGQVGMVLRGARYREDMSQKELARRSGVSQENISRIENGKRVAGEKVAKKLAKPLKIDYRLLLDA